jgi:hypothetical protein
MDPVTRAREFLLDNVGHMTRPGQPSFDFSSHRWFVPIRCRTPRGDVVIGDIELDRDGHIVFAPSREELAARIGTATALGTHPPQAVAET